MTDGVKICPSATCEHPNPVSAVRCGKCGDLLLTVPVTYAPETRPAVAPQPTPPANGPVLKWTTWEGETPIAPRLLVGRVDPAPPELAARLESHHTNVSKRHAELNLVDGQVTVTDLGSMNGTFCNGDRIPVNQPVPIGSGDRLRFGADVEAILVIR
jgi:hypothetical protein